VSVLGTIIQDSNISFFTDSWKHPNSLKGNYSQFIPLLTITVLHGNILLKYEDDRT
jgi:hypothetical protein